MGFTFRAAPDCLRICPDVFCQKHTGGNCMYQHFGIRSPDRFRRIADHHTAQYARRKNGTRFSRNEYTCPGSNSFINGQRRLPGRNNADLNALWLARYPALYLHSIAHFGQDLSLPDRLERLCRCRLERPWPLMPPMQATPPYAAMPPMPPQTERTNLGVISSRDSAFQFTAVNSCIYTC